MGRRRRHVGQRAPMGEEGGRGAGREHRALRLHLVGLRLPRASKPGIDETAAVATIADPTTEKITGETYGALKASAEKAAKDAMPGKVAVVRPGLIVGPEDPSDRFTYWPVRVAEAAKCSPRALPRIRSS